MTAAARPAAGDGFTPRQQQVLTAALEVLVAEGDRLTMTAVARQANCSKETLYKWFGGRDGLLTATVQWQASKVRAPQIDRARLDAASLEAGIAQFASDLLGTIASPVSVTLNRLAINHAGPDSSGLGAVMLLHGPAAVRRRGERLLEAGREAGLLRFASGEDAYRALFGLVVRDLQIRLLLGESMSLTPNTIAADARVAAQRFLRLFGAPRADEAGEAG